jgi:hypothetical protein
MLGPWGEELPEATGCPVEEEVVPGPTRYVLLMRYWAVMPLKRIAAASSVLIPSGSFTSCEAG